ncbi:hypothetical protein H6P81_020047 [Aristolochia fimbriata]|uniref:Uncharacterized protein n=1 Tax=Aristolochia fimbriata TaxID=158543 RepID=A0AAV7DTE1_ARIFI|nr:hypothetical protein H6P81_020047 [Aristolochia fimbriata]
MAYCFRGVGGNESDREDIGADGAHRPGALLSSHDLDAVLGLSGRAGAGGGLVVHRLREHHRLFRHLRPGHGNGTHLRPSVRSEAVEPPGPHAPAHRPPPPLRVPTHLLPLAQHEADPPLVRTGRGDLLRRPRLHRLLHPRPLLPLPPPPPPRLPPDPERDPPLNLLLRPLRPPPRPPQLPPRGAPQDGNRRRRPRHGVDQPQPPPPPPPLCVRLRRLPGLVGGPHRTGLPPRLVLPPRPRRPHLRLRLPRVVVVRADDRPLRPVGQPQGLHRLHGHSHPDHLTCLRLPLRPRPRGLDPGRERARSEPAREGPHCHDRLPLRGGCTGARGDALHHADAAQVGTILHGGQRDPGADRGCVAHRRALRARELPADDRVRGAAGHSPTRRRRQHQSGVVLSRRDARRRLHGIPSQDGFRGALARPPRGPGLLRFAHALRHPRVDELGGGSREGEATD